MGSLDNDSFNNSFGPARTMSFANHTKDTLIMEIGVLKNKLRAAEEEADSYRKEVNTVNQNIVVMHERERRLEEMVLELSFELGGKGGPPPKPKEYSVTPEEAIDRYIQMAVTALERDKRVWELKCEEFERKAREAEERLAAALKQQQTAKPVEVEREKYSGPTQTRSIQTTLVGEVVAASQVAAKAKESKKSKADDDDDADTAVKLALLEKELADKSAELKKKKQAFTALKQKQANTVEKATQRINEKKDRIKELETLLKVNNISFISVSDAASPINSAPTTPAAPITPITPSSEGGRLPPPIGSRYTYKGSSVKVRWSGEEAKLGPGWWLGLEYLNEANGKNNGTARGIEFFKCPDNHGVFAPWPKCEKSMTPE